MRSCSSEAGVPRGYVPIIVGVDGVEEAEQRFLVPIEMLNTSCIAALLDMAAEEFGYEHEGVIRIPCSVEHFKRAVDEMVK
ncbi:hypothetical protein HPP92_011937 [Vanilla planifolia]|uniref:Small auxin up regulated protein n=1 Tax=Vanilla planifolia TaxID=51239 RepID=A0A835V4T7_VANPL|nr:hypothetical protein HPP92_011859 [Vanilla planifolia]KAG0483853.1 hypothetical protein HPP92_011937 [Vanilla planifolia]